MAVDIFLHLSNGVKGESQDSVHGVSGHGTGIDVLAWNWNLSQSGTTHMGGGGGGGKVNIGDIAITKYVDASSNDLIKKCCDGTHFENAKLIVRKAGGETGPVEYFQINMEMVMVTSYSTGGSSDGLDRIQESLTLNFRKVEVVYKGQDDAGVEAPAAKASWNAAENIPWDGGPADAMF